MYYRRCESCGSKALASATRCPRCEAAFELYDEHGQRHRLVPCTGCKVVQPVHVLSCRWCGTERRHRRAIPGRLVAGVSVALAASLLLVSSRHAVVPLIERAFSAPAVQAGDVTSSIAMPAADSSHAVAPAPLDVTEPARLLASDVGSAPGGSAAGAAAANPAQETSAAPEVRDSLVVHWDEAKATTWVNVRADRRPDAAILAILNPDDIVRLGARAKGWRQVHVAGASGWVDPRHFAITRQ
jgi:hypothetical protein